MKKTQLCTHHLGELSVGYGLTAKLDVEGVGARYARGVHETDRTVPVVDDVDVDIRVAVAADAAGDVTLTGLGCVHLDDALLVHRDRGRDVV